MSVTLTALRRSCRSAAALVVTRSQRSASSLLLSSADKGLWGSPRLASTGRRIGVAVAALAGAGALAFLASNPGKDTLAPTNKAQAASRLWLCTQQLLSTTAPAAVVVATADVVNDPVVVSEHAEAAYLNGDDPNEVYDYLRAYLALDGAQRTGDVLWRYARACREKSLLVSGKPAKKELIMEGYEAAKEAVAADPNSFAAHKWVGIMLNNVGEHVSLKQQLLDSYEIETHFKKACELNPADATSRHLLGVWCFTFADLPWYQRKLASTVFATPPSSTYDEAFAHFSQAEQIDPGFYTKNALYLGKTALRLKRRDEAKKWLSQCVGMEVKNPEDQEAIDEATSLLKGL